MASGTRLSSGIGQLIATLETEGLRDNTLIWFMSDNGGLIKDGASPLPIPDWTWTGLDWLFDRPYPIAALEFFRTNLQDGGSNNGPYKNGKGSVYEGGVLVPSLINWPGHLAPGSVLSRVTVMDVLPTLLQAASIQNASVQTVEVLMDGISQWPAITGQSEVEPADYVTKGFDGEGLYHGDWKLIALAEDDFRLYNLAEDPFESNDLAAKEPERVRQLDRILQTYPRGPSIHATPPLKFLFDVDAFGGEIDRAPWAEKVRNGLPPPLE